MTGKIDYAPLRAYVTRSQLAGLKRRSGTALEWWRQSGAARAHTHRAWAIVLSVILLIAASYQGIAIFLQLNGHNRVPNIIAGTIALVIFTAFDANRLIRIHRLRTPNWKTWARLDSFARANSLTFTPVESFPGFPGEVFSAGEYGRALNVVYSMAERAHRFGTHNYSSVDRVLSIGNYEYTVNTRNDTETYDWGFMALQLERKLPHMVLDAKANNSLGRTNLPRVFDKHQILSLEGDFDSFFTLYCPKKYERDALYVFTPDLMVLLIDKAAPFDVEIVDNWMFVYSAKPLKLTNPATYRRLLHIADTVGKKAFSQSRRYSDARVADFSENLVDASGQRLNSWEKVSLRQGLTLGSNLEVRLAAALGFGVVLAFMEVLFAR